MSRLIPILVAVILGLPSAWASEDIRFDVPVLPGFEKYENLLEQPGIVAVALENNNLSPSLSSKLKVGDQGRSLEIRNGAVRYTGRKGAIFNYEAVYMLGVGNTKVSFPVALDASQIRRGKISAILSPPLVKLIPAELTEKIRLKVVFIANADAQKQLLAYLDRQPRRDLERAILVDAYNLTGGPAVEKVYDVGDALPLSDQALLFVTLLIWIVMVPAAIWWYRARRRRSN